LNPANDLPGARRAAGKQFQTVGTKCMLKLSDMQINGSKRETDPQNMDWGH